MSGADGWSLALAAHYNNWLILALAVVFAALVALTLLSYHREGDTPRRSKLLLAGLRVFTLGLLFALLLEPAMVLRYRQDVQSHLVVLVDDSLSMSIADRAAGSPEGLAAKLGIPADELAKLSRSQIAQRLLSRPGGALERLSREHPLTIVGFSTSQPSVQPYTRSLGQVSPAMTPAAADADIAKALSQLLAGGYETNLAAALRDAADRLTGLRGAGIVLVSDGQATSEDSSSRLGSALAYLRQRGLPVYALAVGDSRPVQSVSALRLQAPAEARQGSNLEFTAILAHRNAAGQAVTLELFRRAAGTENWSSPVATEKVTLSADDAEGAVQDVSLHLDANDLGEFEYRLAASAGDQLLCRDDCLSARVRVTDQKLKVLLVSGGAGWEMQYLRNLLLRGSQRYGVSVWQEDAETAFNQDASTGMQLSQLPRTRNELYDYDVVILYDPAYTEGGFDKTFVEMLEGFVSEHHGGLCYIAGSKFSEKNLTGPGSVFTALANVLPVELASRTLNIAEEISHTEPMAWPFVPTSLGLESPILRMGRNAEETRNTWSLMPGVYWLHPVTRLKPLASALAVTTSRTADGSGQPTPLLAVQYYGKGRSLYLGTDETWRWRFVADGAYYHRFWGNVMDFLAGGRTEKKRVVITAGGDRFQIGQEMRITVEAYDRNYEPSAQETFDVEMVDAAGASAKITLHRDEKSPKGRYEATVALKSLGTFELTAFRGDEQYKNDVAGKTLVVTLPEEEFRRREANRAALDTIAPAPRTLDLEEADKLPGLIPSGRMSVYHEIPHDLWDTPAVLVLGVVLLGVEWILRKKHNMA